MTRHSLHIPAMALLAAMAGLSACADNTQTAGLASQPQDVEAAARYAEFTGAAESNPNCVAAGGETVGGMPATQHQVQVLGMDEAQAAATEPAAGCPDAGGMPSTQHQQQLLDGSASEGSSY